MSKQLGATAALPPRLTWREAMATFRVGRQQQGRILNGSLIMLTGTGMVSLLNFGYNVAVARMLGPTGFGHAAAAVTLLMLVSAITLSFQLVCAKLVARAEFAEVRCAVYHGLMRRAWKVGLALGSALALCSGVVADYLNLPTRWIVLLLSFGIAFYVPLGARRGAMQGICAFPRLTWNFIIEAGVKFVLALLLVELGFGALGAVGAITASVVLAYFVPSLPQELRLRRAAAQPVSFRESMQALVFFVGQVVINNIDILLVKHFFPSDVAGLYAAVALVGRVVYFASWSVVSAMFPISAGAKREESAIGFLAVPLLLVLAISVVFVSVLGFFPDLALRAVFGAGFNGGALDGLLSLYAAATGLYALSVVLITYEMSRRIANTAWIQLAFSGAIVLGIYFFHNDLTQVVLVQLVLMTIMLFAVSLPFVRRRTPAVLEEAA